MNAQKRIREAYAMMTAAEHRAQAADCRDRVADSWERSDTDGFLSQWAWGLTENLHIRQAEILEAGGRSEFSGLYQGDRRVAAKQIETQYGECWLLRDDEAAQFGRKFIPFVGCGGGSSRVQKRLGLSERREMAPAKAIVASKGRGLSGSAWVATVRTDGNEWGLGSIPVKEAGA